jgi:hypothetical protein
MKSIKIVLIALFAIIASSQGYFFGFGLDKDLVGATDRAMSNLQGLLTVFSCRGNRYFFRYLVSSITLEVMASIPVAMYS